MTPCVNLRPKENSIGQNYRQNFAKATKIRTLSGELECKQNPWLTRSCASFWNVERTGIGSLSCWSSAIVRFHWWPCMSRVPECCSAEQLAKQPSEVCNTREDDTRNGSPTRRVSKPCGLEIHRQQRFQSRSNQSGEQATQPIGALQC